MRGNPVPDSALSAAESNSMFHITARESNIATERLQEIFKIFIEKLICDFVLTNFAWSRTLRWLTEQGVRLRAD